MKNKTKKSVRLKEIVIRKIKKPLVKYIRHNKKITYKLTIR
jgi:hypothetical protein